jgi:S1-C subfamily serine protease
MHRKTTAIRWLARSFAVLLLPLGLGCASWFEARLDPPAGAKLEDAWRLYQISEDAKAMAIAIDDTAAKRAWGMRYGYFSQDSANKGAMEECAANAKRAGLNAKCHLFAVGDQRPAPAVRACAEGRAQKSFCELMGSLVPPGDSPVRHEQTSLGTCFSVDGKGLIVTAAHVVENSSRIRVRLASGDLLEAAAVKIDRANDVAILKVRASGLPFLRLSNSGPAIGQPVFTVGYPLTDLLGSEPKYTEGTISALSGPGNAPNRVQVSLPIQPGNSGGPLVGFDGYVLGVVVSTANPAAVYDASGTLPQAINWAVKAGYLRPLLALEPQPSAPLTREQAISLALEAVCQVEAT